MALNCLSPQPIDIPVPYLDKEFDLALIGTKGTWYDHKVSVSDVAVKKN